MRRVIIESPYAGDVAANLDYLRECMRDCLMRGEAPFASHGLYTQPGVLDDLIPEERELGIKAGFAWRVAANATVVYVDRGISPGMIQGMRDAVFAPWPACPIDIRSLRDNGVAVRDAREMLHSIRSVLHG